MKNGYARPERGWNDRTSVREFWRRLRKEPFPSVAAYIRGKVEYWEEQTRESRGEANYDELIQRDKRIPEDYPEAVAYVDGVIDQLNAAGSAQDRTEYCRLVNQLYQLAYPYRFSSEAGYAREGKDEVPYPDLYEPLWEEKPLQRRRF